MSNKLLIFDLDGTLSDTQPLLHTMVYRSLISGGVEIESPQAVTKSIKTSGSTVFEDSRAMIPCEFFDKVEPEKYGVDFWNNYDDLFMESVNRLYDGMHETLVELKNRGYILAVLSNKKDEYVKPIISTAFEGLFSFVLGRSAECPKKPAPDGIFFICNEAGIAPENTCMIGDLATDYLASRNAGCDHIIANWGYGHEKGLRKQGATVFAEQPIDLLEILK